MANEKCVWKLDKRDISYICYQTTCNWHIPHKQFKTQWLYCPYCGREIEVKDGE